IESALNPTAVSKAGAKGTWQFMHQTAKSYGLEINSYVDERFDTFKAADAAARYLRDSYKIFGDWNLAISSYNCGAGNVNKAIRRAGGRNGFWSIFAYRPKETRGYVPAFVGAMYAFAYYKEYGIKPAPASMPAHVDTFEIKKPLHFKQVSELVGISMDELHNLNPQYIHDIIPGGKTYILRIPYNYSSAFVAQEDSVYTYKANEYLPQATLQNIKNGVYSASSTSSNGTVETRIAYKVKSGDTLGKIASKNKTTVAKLKSWNHLKSDKLKVGQVIYIYKYTAAPKTTTTTSSSSSSSTSTAKTAATTSTTAKADTTAQAAKDSSSVAAGAETKEEVKEQAANSEKNDEPEYIEYKVVAGDTVFKISQKFGLTANEIMEYNKIDANIKQGQILRIPNKKK
ncbi:MAG: LysM peptidoglycan-binding domain-containing protein, partial [Bacteroidales bacterium]|nr:LysM peptidoglycan-binding domain-containing protein [Bacteroidales bacterium]